MADRKSGPSAFASDPLPTLDHLVHKVNPGQLERAISVFSVLGFTVKRGGKHANGLTANALITFPDGVYLEIIAFQEHPIAATGELQAQFETRRRKHPWWRNSAGWINWALLGGAENGQTAEINQRAEQIGVQMRYSAPIAAGRTTTEGKKLEWKISVPEGNVPRSAVPFLCEDATPRTWRVPPPDPPHRNRSSGISALTILYPPGEDSQTFSLQNLAIVLGEKFTRHVTPTQPSLPVTTLDLSVVHVRVADDPSELKWVAENGAGLFEVEIRVAADQLPSSAPPDGLEQTTQDEHWGRIRLHPVFNQA
ncbi:hypothetical protein K437DRAFT_262764 [Tilletiaria anomala UBC 951]|uniref:Glyoxalase-like domain-containing protein n=1 Tax=Tilletiaria anomala (strain ATCC 24038 / CBS 436.72 / UBC 951) TaxID=1037660 RepID=A0A066W4Y0_TILAU|nr:uncharacterized protein K437DRAFT_262764 [Tilletiaria anomala UBC 951]KDN46139.1 hypothetical protein K437DRAFT_262764 [Tilletiaria anomala UBC 951]